MPENMSRCWKSFSLDGKRGEVRFLQWVTSYNDIYSLDFSKLIVDRSQRLQVYNVHFRGRSIADEYSGNELQLDFFYTVFPDGEIC
jgi:hypothetical protein